ncbi:alpha-amylase family glycosyl hydrolase [Bradyrhizobium sp. 195]|uniref:alpha-amylase family glycosyl hydrolase n=1 Tax=Bradyrhizobium sp. 195 TaxID=2782662 RepID=UPI0032119880
MTNTVASKVGQAQARILAMLLMTIRGTPFLFAGDEMGSEQVQIPPERIQDPFEKLMKGFDVGRDPERAPLRWDDTEGGGFTSGEPWLPLSRDRTRNIKAQQGDRNSLLNLYHELIALRREEPCLLQGEYLPRRAQNDVFSFGRRMNETEILVGLNIFRRTTALGVGRLRRPIVIDRPRLQAGKGSGTNPPEAERRSHRQNRSLSPPRSRRSGN